MKRARGRRGWVGGLVFILREFLCVRSPLGRLKSQFIRENSLNHEKGKGKRGRILNVKKRRKEKSQLKGVAWGIIAVATISLLFVGMWHYFDQAKHPTDLVNFWGRSESVGDTSGIWQLEQDLKSVIIPKIDFAQKPLKECLHFVIDELNKGKKSSGRIKCQFMASETNLEDEISLRLSNVPVAEAFRYVTSMAKAKYVVEGGGVIEIWPITSYSDKTLEAKFHCRQHFFPTHTGKGPIPVMKDL
ncbi:MAG: hypothetical protein KAG66_14130, partial [Methylococcales bacterium]|nr:hypothetical protein [Methylococcales bacterium]